MSRLNKLNKLLIIPDQHAHPSYNNNRADWLSSFIKDTKPDIVVNIGDAADMPSLSSFDKGKRSFHGRYYKDDINSHLDFQERLWGPVKKSKRKLPYRVILEGNHEHRVEKALDLSPELEGTIGFNDYDFSSYYNDIIRYEGNTPGVIEIEGILFSHYFISGIMGRPVSSKNPAKAILDLNKQSCIQGHSHTLDYSSQTTQGSKKLHSIVCGCYQDYLPKWAEGIGKLWSSGVVILDNLNNGDFDFQFISLNTLKDIYNKETNEIRRIE